MNSVPESVYEKIGGEVGLKRLVNSFYSFMDQLPEAKGIRLMHEPDLNQANKKLFMFLSGWLGGPDLFVQNYGHPRLRARHLPFSIGKSERDAWMLCMVHAFDECDIKDPIRSELLYSLLNLADRIRNKEES